MKLKNAKLRYGGAHSKKRYRGQAMTEYIVVSMGILFTVLGTHSAWEAYNSNRAGGMINGRAENGREYENVVSGIGENGGTPRADAISWQDGIVQKRERFRDKVAELTY